MGRNSDPGRRMEAGYAAKTLSQAMVVAGIDRGVMDGGLER